MTYEWVPGADALALARRGHLLRTIREFFHQRGVLEVSTPVLGATGVSDVHIENIGVPLSLGHRYLQTSPEYLMKRLLAAGAGAIYQLGPAFRGAESGDRHNTEFTLLEWYRPGFDLPDLAEEVEALLTTVFEAFDRNEPPCRQARYKDLFMARWGVDPHRASLDELRELAGPLASDHIAQVDDTGTQNDYLDLLFSAGVETDLRDPVLIFEYPASQAALASTGTDGDGDAVALRFECLWQGVELANGYYELRDADELRQRMQINNALRRARGLPEIPPDEKLLAALPNMPSCSGVALGVDRLLMLLMDRHSLDEVLPFADRRL